MTAPTGSRHFRLEPIGEGAWAAIAVPGGGAVGNAGVVDLGGRALIFDTFMTPAAARDLLAAVTELIHGRVEVVANSHWHADHIRGNGVFDAATVISTTATRELIESLGVERLEAHRRYAQEHLAELREHLSEVTDEDERLELGSDLAVLESVGDVEILLADRTFDEAIELEGTHLPVRLDTDGAGHTQSDGFLVLEQAGILFAGDLVVVNHHPNLTHGDPQNWLTILDRLEALRPARVLPGHGPMAGVESIGWVRSYLEEIMTVVAEATEKGAPVEDIVVPVPFRDLGFPEQFAANVAFLADR